MLSNKSFSRSMSGIALIEVLVTALVLAVGIMGMAGLQLKSVQFNQASYLRSQANVLAYDMMDRMRLNSERARNGEYDMSYASTSSGTSLLATDRREWLLLISQNLPSGQGSIDCDETQCTVSIRWKESAEADEEAWVVAEISSRI